MAGLQKHKSPVDGLGRMFSLLLNEISYKSRFPIQRIMGNVSLRQTINSFVLKYLHGLFFHLQIMPQFFTMGIRIVLGGRN